MGRITAAQCGQGKKNWHESTGISASVSRPQWGQVMRDVVLIGVMSAAPPYPVASAYSPGSNGAFAADSALSAASRSFDIRVPAASA